MTAAAIDRIDSPVDSLSLDMPTVTPTVSEVPPNYPTSPTVTRVPVLEVERRFPGVLISGLPTPLQQFREILEVVAKHEAPNRMQRWESYERDAADGKPLRSGESEQDPNSRIYTITNDYLILRHEGRFRQEHNCLDDERFREIHAKSKAILAELRYWQEELGPVIRTWRAYKAALAVFEKAAPVRVVPPCYPINRG